GWRREIGVRNATFNVTAQPRKSFPAAQGGAAMYLLSARTWTLVALALAFAAPAAAEDKATAAEAAPKQYLLRYKFAAGEILRYDVRHATNVRTTIDGTTEKSETQSDSVKAWKVTDVLPNGEMEFIHVVEWVHMSNDSGAASHEYDSRKDAKPPRGFEQAARAVGVPLSLIRIAPDGEVVFREEKHPQPKPTDD